MSLSLSEVQGVRSGSGLVAKRNFVGFIRDLTEIERLMESVEGKSQQLQAIFNSVADSLLAVDEEGTVMSANVAAGMRAAHSFYIA